MSPAILPPLDLAVRVGCALTYYAPTSVSILLNLRPRTGLKQQVQAEKIVLGHNLPCEEITDTHGNVVHRLILQPGYNEIRHDAIVLVPHATENEGLSGEPLPPGQLPPDLLRYTLPSRYADSDKLLDFAWKHFGHVPNGLPRVRAICDWVHRQIEYRFGSGQPDLSAADVIARGYGVCRDFAHTAIALCRAFNLPARYVTGHLPDIGYVDPGTPMDFHAYLEVYLGGHWFTFDARYNVPRVGRVKIACGLDAVDVAFSTIYGSASLAHFEVWAYQIENGTVSVGDPIDLSKRLDGTEEVMHTLAAAQAQTLPIASAC